MERDLRVVVYGWLAFTFEMCRQRVVDPSIDADNVADTCAHALLDAIARLPRGFRRRLTPAWVSVGAGTMANGPQDRRPHEPLQRAVREWFTGTFPAPTAAQADAWEAIAGGENTLVIAPTGSGKTLAAFLWAIDQLAARNRSPRRAGQAGTRVLYISPLKALAVDVERNLSTPLTGITRVAERQGIAAPEHHRRRPLR